MMTFHFFCISSDLHEQVLLLFIYLFILFYFILFFPFPLSFFPFVLVTFSPFLKIPPGSCCNLMLKSQAMWR
jgi:hypothetical protein